MGVGVATITVTTKADPQAGFSLVELTVVVAVIASLALGVSLTLGRAPSPETRDLAQFRATYAQVRSLAIHGQETRGLLITSQGQRLARWQATGWQMSEHMQAWQGAVTYLSGSPRRSDPEAPNLLFLPNGQTSAFWIQLGPVRCQSDGWTGLTCGRG